MSEYIKDGNATRAGKEVYPNARADGQWVGMGKQKTMDLSPDF